MIPVTVKHVVYSETQGEQTKENCVLEVLHEASLKTQVRIQFKLEVGIVVNKPHPQVLIYQVMSWLGQKWQRGHVCSL